MATIIEVQSDKIENLSEIAEKMLRYGGKLMRCLEELENKGGGYSERYGNRGSMRGGYRDWEEQERYLRYY